LEIENKKYKTELEEFKKEFQEVQNQEVTIRRLQDQIAEYEKKMENKIQSKVESIEKSITDDTQQKIKSLKER
jgi:hypothetical protein